MMRFWNTSEQMFGGNRKYLDENKSMQGYSVASLLLFLLRFLDWYHFFQVVIIAIFNNRLNNARIKWKQGELYYLK